MIVAAFQILDISPHLQGSYLAILLQHNTIIIILGTV
jgi:hypothetical protein